MTCNPSWREIVEELLPGQTSQDRPDLITRIFHAKFEEFKSDVVDKSALGKVVAYVYVIEFQKRGLPHVHMLLILDENDKPRSPEEYDKIVRAEIPDRDEEPQLYDAVLKHMIHNPCGAGHRNSSCMENGVCKRKFPKPFSASTIQGDNSYPIYRRRGDLPAVPLHENSTTYVDNSWVVPYNPWLLLKYDCHINVEICSSIKCVKYLYKYVHKGVDRISMEVRTRTDTNEIQQFIDARWVCAPEALWRIYQFTLTRMCPSMERLQLHLQNKHQIRFNKNQYIEDFLQMPQNSRTMLTEFFKMNLSDPEARKYLYIEFPQHYRWLTSSKTWRKRRNKQRVIGRIYTASPMEGERFFLRLLLNHVRGPESFQHLRTVNGIVYPTFREAAEKHGLMENDASILDCLHEASNSKMPSSLRKLFVTLLVCCQPTGVRSLWDEFYPFMAEDHTFSSPSNTNFVRDSVLYDIERILKQLSKSITDFDLPEISMQLDGNVELARVIHEEISAPVPPEDVHCVEHLNDDQRNSFNAIMEAIDGDTGQIFFINGLGGTGKTFLYRAILATIKLRRNYGLAVASSGIAATLLHRGKTAHKTFGIPVSLHASSTWKFSKQDIEAQLVKHAAVIIWDEATMTHRHAYEAVDRNIRDLMGVDIPFGGKVVVFGGDFRQILPVVPKGTKAQTIDACLVRSTLWRHVQILRLSQNMRSRNDEEFAAFLLRVGDGS
ncbi:uncharacterized protein [Spinacia oleracea]|uniref:ATP-dependent DNA helicase n=1 Tax=Spinacia oleracea TaxID=3562 RepID=A0ABM3RQ00_SPIOL|nr:uncharacterized protein LOC130471532 [Spinacia oleracea]